MQMQTGRSIAPVREYQASLRSIDNFSIQHLRLEPNCPSRRCCCDPAKMQAISERDETMKAIRTTATALFLVASLGGAAYAAGAGANNGDPSGTDSTTSTTNTNAANARVSNPNNVELGGQTGVKAPAARTNDPLDPNNAATPAPQR